MEKSDKQKRLEKYFEDKTFENKILERANEVTEEDLKNHLQIAMFVSAWLKETSLSFKIVKMENSFELLNKTASLLDMYCDAVKTKSFEEIRKLFQERCAKIELVEDAQIIEMKKT